MIFRLTVEFDYPLEHVALMLTSTEEKLKYEKFLKEQKTTKIIDENTVQIYSHIKMPMMISDRELL